MKTEPYTFTPPTKEGEYFPLVIDHPEYTIKVRLLPSPEITVSGRVPTVAELAEQFRGEPWVNVWILEILHVIAATRKEAKP